LNLDYTFWFLRRRKRPFRCSFTILLNCHMAIVITKFEVSLDLGIGEEVISVDCFIFYILFRNVCDKQFLDCEKYASVLVPLAERSVSSARLCTSTCICISSPYVVNRNLRCTIYGIRFCFIALYEVIGRILSQAVFDTTCSFRLP
jgi:hypothetical protein